MDKNEDVFLMDLSVNVLNGKLSVEYNINVDCFVYEDDAKVIGKKISDTIAEIFLDCFEE